MSVARAAAPTFDRLVGAVRTEVCSQLAAGQSQLGESATRSLLEEVVAFGAARSSQRPVDAVNAAEELGFPVVLKALSPRLLHKTEHGLVALNLKSGEEVSDAAQYLLERAHAAGFVRDLELSIQTQLSGVEVAIGVRRNELGAFCMVAAGGVLVELLDDSAVAMVPLDEGRARALIDELRIAPLLDGYRGRPAPGRHALGDLLVRVSELAEAVPELVELDLNPVFIGLDGALAADARCVLAPIAQTHGESPPDGATVKRIFEPRRIAIVGATRDTRKPGGLLLRYLRKHGFDGDIVAVNPRDVKLDGIPTHPSVTAITGDPVDLACIAVPAAHVRKVIHDCVQTSIPAGIIYSSGYAESGADGRRAQDEVLKAARGRFRFVGPNSIGAASPSRRMLATFGMALEQELPPPGAIALVSQSGAIATALVSRTSEFGAGLSHWISTGNEADLGMADFIDYLASDDNTSVICLFLEVVRRPKAFQVACSRARQSGKAVIAFKTGRSDAGRAAAASHTGAMTGADRTYEAFLEDCGVLRVPDLASLFSAAQGVLLAGAATGPRVGIISMSGGACSLLADSCSQAGLQVPVLPPETQGALSELLPSFGSTRNPVDITAQGIGSPGLVRATLELVQASGAVDLILIQLSTNADPAAQAMATDLAGAFNGSGVPFLVGRLGSSSLAPKALKVYRDAGIHIFVWPEQLVQAGRAAAWYGATGAKTIHAPAVE